MQGYIKGLFFLFLVNVALNRPSHQSSTFDSLGVADHGNDGLDGSRYSKNGCSRTQVQTNPWWMVDLRRRTRTKSVVLTKDSDPHYGQTHCIVSGIFSGAMRHV